MQIESKVFVVTGGGSGIGRALTLGLVRKGARVAAVDINEKTLQETVELAGDLKEKISIHVVNIADKAAVEALPAAVLAAHKVVDGIINNAGVIQKFVRFKDLAYAEIERMIDINFYGTIYMTKAFLPLLIQRPEANITNVSSMGGFLPVPGQTMYGASKAAVKLFTEGLHSELTGTNVHATVVFPGAIETNISVNSGVSITTSNPSEKPKSMKTTPAPVAAEKIIEGIERNSYRVLIGGDAKLMDFLSRTAPKAAAGFIYKMMGSLLSE